MEYPKYCFRTSKYLGSLGQFSGSAIFKFCNLKMHVSMVHLELIFFFQKQDICYQCRFSYGLWLNMIIIQGVVCFLEKQCTLISICLFNVLVAVKTPLSFINLLENSIKYSHPDTRKLLQWQQIYHELMTVTKSKWDFYASMDSF